MAKMTIAELIALRKAQRQETVQTIEIPAVRQELETPKASNTEPSNTEPKRRTIAEILAAKRAARQSTEEQNKAAADALLPIAIEPETEENETFSLSIELNSQQILARDLALAGKSFVYIGAAGTGKTTGLREIAKSLLESDRLRTHTFKIQGTAERVEAPSIAIVAWTRIASGNARRAIHKDPNLERTLTHNITTLHNLLEYQPEFYFNMQTGQDSMRFVPKRTAANKLDITHLIIEEASLVDLVIWENLYAALRPGVQIIFVGDINQLPPVFGPSILNFALTQLPTVELTHVYRQAGDSLVLENAHNILAGNTLQEGEDFEIIRCGEVQHGQEKLSHSLGITFPKWMAAGKYDPEQDIILSPWNKNYLGTDNINNWIAQKLGVERKATVHQILAGRKTWYLAVGDKIMYNKIAGIITAIHHNPMYMGRAPMSASIQLSRFGSYIAREDGTEDEDDDFELAGYENLDIDALMDQDIDLARQCSHHVVIMTVDGDEHVLESIGDLSPASFSLGYALTVHKAQGCEWRKVFLVMHKDHAVTLSREFIYTAVTRAREACIIIAKEHLINTTIKRQRIKGTTLRDKIEYFNADLAIKGDVKCTK